MDLLLDDDSQPCRKFMLRVLFSCVLILQACLPAYAQQVTQDCTATIRHIEVSGNKVTQRDNLIKWSGLKVGSRLTAANVILAKQKLLDTGLYREVNVSTDDLCEPEVDISISIVEKRYQLIYPRLSRNGDGDIDKGITYQGSNLFGSDHTLKVTASKKDYASGDSAERIVFSYDMPLSSQPYLLRWSGGSIDTLLSHTAQNVIESDQSFAFLVGRDWHNDNFTQPVQVFAKFNLQQKSLSQPSSQTDLLPGYYNTIGIRLEYDDVHHEKFRRYGKFYALEINRGMEFIQTDFEVSHLQLEARYYHRINSLDNFNSRFIVALASGDVFNQHNYSMGGNSTLRGIESDSVSGNNLWQGNLEYVIGFNKYRGFRLSLFSDVGNVFDDHSQINDHDWQQTFGIGMRWKIQSFVNTDLVIDYAQDSDTGFSKIYASTSLNF